MFHTPVFPECAGQKTDNAPASVPERRTSQRYVTVLKVGRAVVNEQEQLCLLRNVSQDGAKLDLSHDVSPDQKILIELHSDKRITGTVRWTGPHVAGVQFDTPIDLQDMLQKRSTRKSVLRRLPRAPRFSAMGRVHLEQEDAILHGDLVNISLYGLCLETGSPFHIDDDVVVRIAGLSPRRGSVRWLRSGRVGIHFDLPMGYSELARWLEDQKSAA